MAEEIKDVNSKIDEAEQAVKKYASKDTVISIGGYEFTPAKLMVAFTLVSSLLGGLYGSFEVAGQRLAERDALGITDFDQFELKALTKDAEILLMEIPMGI